MYQLLYKNKYSVNRFDAFDSPAKGNIRGPIHNDICHIRHVTYGPLTQNI